MVELTPWRSSSACRTSAKAADPTCSTRAPTPSARTGVRLLDVKPDASHNRTVFTFAGEPAAVKAAVLALFAAALPRIDLREHQGEHPRMGAVDVVPFIPIEGVTMADCVRAGASTWPRRSSAAHELPVFLYEEAARQPGRRNLEDIRRGEFEGLGGEAEAARVAARLRAGGARTSSAGASVVGARMPLIAYNINLATNRLDVAKKIASGGAAQLRRAALREGDGHRARRPRHRPGLDEPDQLRKDADRPRLRAGETRGGALRRHRARERNRRTRPGGGAQRRGRVVPADGYASATNRCSRQGSDTRPDVTGQRSEVCCVGRDARVRRRAREGARWRRQSQPMPVIVRFNTMRRP